MSLLSSRHRTVVCFLSPSSVASRVAQEKLASLLGWNKAATSPVDNNNNTSNPMMINNEEWDRVAIECPQSGTILQWLSMDQKSEHPVTPERPFGLLAVQQAASADEADNELQASLAKTMSTTKLTLKRWTGQSVTIKDLLGKHSLPVLQWKDAEPEEGNDDESSSSSCSLFASGVLKEIALPTYDTAQYSDGRTLRERLSAAPLHRPATGLYQLPGGLVLRPLPTCSADRYLAPPSLVFHRDNDKLVDDNFSSVTQPNAPDNANYDDDVQVHKIGYNGCRRGQDMVRSAAWWGMDVRFCSQTKHTPGFAEAQEALLAASLPSLQSAHVLEGANGTVDPKNLQTDCWVEFRESLKHNPVAFWSSSKKGKGPKIAKVPDLPYE